MTGYSADFVTNIRSYLPYLSLLIPKKAPRIFSADTGFQSSGISCTTKWSSQ